MNMILTYNKLKKNYGKKEALREVSFDIREGVCGLLGPNGAGKSTLMNITAGNLEATSGEILLDGKRVDVSDASFRARLGYMPQQQALYPDFQVIRFLAYVAALQGMKREKVRERIREVLELVELSDAAHQKIRSLSGGMKQRLLIAQAVIHDPDILILDEPTAGLDPKQRIAIRNLIARIAMHKIVILATHVVSDVEYIANDILLLKDGQVHRHDTRSGLTEEIRDRVFELKIQERQLEEISAQFRVGNIIRDGDWLRVRVLADALPEGIPAEKMRPELEDVYLWHFGE